MFGMSITSISSIMSKPKNKTISAAYTLKQLDPLLGINGNVSVYMDNSANNIYLCSGVGNIYVGNIISSPTTWSQSALANGSSGQFENRNWQSIVCNGSGQYVVACVRSPTINDPSGVVFYSSNYGNTFTMSNISANTYCFSMAMSSNGNYTYLSAWGEPTPSATGFTNVGNLYKSLDQGITWSIIALSANGYNFTKLASQVRCNSTGEYISLSFWKGLREATILSNYGNTILYTGVAAGVGYINSSPGIITGVGGAAVGVIAINRTSSINYSYMDKVSVYTTSPFTSYMGVSQNSPHTFAQDPGANTYYPWTGMRQISSTSDFKTILLTNTGQAGSTSTYGNIYICSNGMYALSWFSTATVNGAGDWSNFTTANNIPKANWSGICVNYNDSFAIANTVGNVYIYSKPLII